MPRMNRRLTISTARSQLLPAGAATAGSPFALRQVCAVLSAWSLSPFRRLAPRDRVGDDSVTPFFGASSASRALRKPRICTGFVVEVHCGRRGCLVSSPAP